MANFNSTQIAAEHAQNTPGSKLDPTDKSGKVRVARFSFASFDAAQNDTLTLCRIPAGARIKEGYLRHSALGTNVTMDIGDGTTVDKYADGLDVAAAGVKSFANTEALAGQLSAKLTAVETIVAKLLSANPDASTISGWVEYVVD